MRPALQRIGRGLTPVVTVDDFSGDVAETIALAAGLAPFPRVVGTYYPGLRRVVSRGEPAFGYFRGLLERVAPFIGGAYDADGIGLIEASFSLITTPADALDLPQRVPHFDATDPRHLAIMHYLNVPPGTGTAFYRQRATGIERVTAETMHRFIAAASQSASVLSGYINESNAAFERIGMVEGVADRLVIYPGSLLHSGIIPPDMPLSEDPRLGRLTANLFIRYH